jgi:hypothetical protein
VAVDDAGQVRGTVATIRYEDHFSWIAMVLVDPAYQRRGIGLQLLREALHILEDEETVKLDATPAGRLLYIQLEFVDEFMLSRMEAASIASEAITSHSAQRIIEEDLLGIVEFDQHIFGANREKMLKAILKREPSLAFIQRDNHRIMGYCMGRQGHLFTHIGPVIARDFETAKSLTSAALLQSQGSRIVIDALHQSAEYLQWLSSIGFREQRQLIRMYRGNNYYPGEPQKQYAIMGPEFG